MNKHLIILGIAVLLICVGLSGCLKPEINVQELELEIHNLINEERRKNGLSELEYDYNLATIARGHSKDMAKRFYFSHYSPEGDGPTERAIKANYPAYKDYGTYYTEGIAENICQDNMLDSGYDICFIPLNDWNDKSELANSIVDSWMNSYGHRQNILDSSYDKEGIGVAFAIGNDVYVTQDFW